MPDADRRAIYAWWIAAAYVALQLAVVTQYGIFRDELYYLACGDHLAWGYVDHPPMIALIARISRTLFGESLLAIRLLSAVAGGATIVLAGRLAVRFGGDRWAAALAAASVAIVPALLFLFHILSMNAWDILLWTALASLVARIVVEGDRRQWLAAGFVIGVGLETKHSMAFLVIGLGAGMLLTRERRWLLDPYLWGGAAIAAAIVAPHVAWQISNGWPTLEFIHNAETMKNAVLTPGQFLLSQAFELHPVNGLLLIGGLWFFFTADGGRLRLFGWAYVVIMLIIVLQHGKTYYLSPSYPFMLAGGSVAASRLLSGRAARAAVFTVVLLSGAIVAPAAFPLLSIQHYIAYTSALGLRPPDAERNATAALPQYFADMFGWDDIVETVAAVYRSLPPGERAKAGIFALNYGDAGAIDFLGPRHGLPIKAISPHNSYYLWGPDDVSGEVLIVIGGRVDDHLESYASVQKAATIECGYCMPFENHRPVYVLRHPKRPMAEIWRTSKKYI